MKAKRVFEIEFATTVNLPDKYDKYTIIKIKGEEKTIVDVDKYSNDAILTFDDGTEASASELEKEKAKFVRKLDYYEVGEIEGDDEDDEYYNEEDERLADLRVELRDIEKEEQEAFRDMELDLSNYDESTWEPTKNTRKSLRTGKLIPQEAPHDVWGGILNDIDERKEKIKKEIKKIIGEPEPNDQLTYDEVLKLRDSLRESENVLKPKTRQEILDAFEKLYEEIADAFYEMDYFDNWEDSYEYVLKFTDKIKYFIDTGQNNPNIIALRLYHGYEFEEYE